MASSEQSANASRRAWVNPYRYRPLWRPVHDMNRSREESNGRVFSSLFFNYSIDFIDPFSPPPLQHERISQGGIAASQPKRGSFLPHCPSRQLVVPPNYETSEGDIYQHANHHPPGGMIRQG